MKIENKAWWVELAWIVSLLLLTLLVDFLIFGRLSVLQDTIGLQVHDTDHPTIARAIGSCISF